MCSFWRVVFRPVPQGSPDEKARACWKVTFKNIYEMTIFATNTVGNPDLLLENVKNTM